MTDNITVKVSGTAVYKAVKSYLDNSEEMRDTIKVMVDKYLETAVKSRIQSILSQLETTTRHKITTELDLFIKKEVETRVAHHISIGVKKLFEGSK